MRFMQWTLKLIKSRTTLVVVALYTLVSFWFYWDTYWSQIAYDRSQMGWEVTGEIRASEWGIEQVLEKLSVGKNPFSRIDGIMYPFGVDIVASDPGLAFLVWPWRQFLSIHQAVILVVVLGGIVGGWGMYWLIIELGAAPMAAFVTGLAYANNTFLLPRMGHVGFVASIGIFPWFFWLLLKFIKCDSKLTKLFLTFALVAFYLASLWVNFYFFMILNLGIGMLLVYYAFTQTKLVWQVIKNNIGYALAGVGGLILMSWRWVNTLYSTLKFSEVAKPQGWGGAIEFSADLFNVIIPSYYNYYYGELLGKLARRVTFMQGIFEDYNYPGIIVIVAIVYGGYQMLRKRTWVNAIRPFFWATFGFGILTLGPFLQVAGRMFVTLEEVRVVMPLPFSILHYFPYLNNLRVPGRLAMGMVFFGLVTAGLIIDRISRKMARGQRFAFWLGILCLIIVDQRPVSSRLESHVPNYPTKLYSIIRNDPENSAVVVIPMTIRDGLTWFGEYNAVNMDFAQTYIQKPLIGGYVGRIPDYVKEYYRSNPLVGKLGRIIDQNLASNPFMLNVPERDPWEEDLDKAVKAVDFLGVKYMLIQKSKPYTCTRYTQVEDYAKLLGFVEIEREEMFGLYMREVDKRDFLSIKLGSSGDNIQLGMGWWGKEKGLRWTQKKATVLLRNQEWGKYKLRIEGLVLGEGQYVSLYIDEKLVGKAKMESELKTVESEAIELAPALHTAHLIFEREQKPSELPGGSLDARSLAGRINEISLVKDYQ